MARDAEQITIVRQQARERQRAARWPSRWQRLRLALLAWLPLALVIGYAGPHVAGCAAGAASACPEMLPAAQALLAAGALATLLLLPRVAFGGAIASAAVLGAAGATTLGGWLLGIRPPQAASLPAWAIGGAALVLVAAYLVVGTWLLSDRRRLPWVGPRGPVLPGEAQR